MDAGISEMCKSCPCQHSIKHSYCSYSMGSYTWKSTWGPKYHQSMIISLCALVISTLLSLGTSIHLLLDESRQSRLQSYGKYWYRRIGSWMQMTRPQWTALTVHVSRRLHDWKVLALNKQWRGGKASVTCINDKTEGT